LVPFLTVTLASIVITAVCDRSELNACRAAAEFWSVVTLLTVGAGDEVWYIRIAASIRRDGPGTCGCAAGVPRALAACAPLRGSAGRVASQAAAVQPVSC
jgi:hypothetical protein